MKASTILRVLLVASATCGLLGAGRVHAPLPGRQTAATAMKTGSRGTVAPEDRPGLDLAVLHAMRIGQYRTAATRLRMALARDPGAADLSCALGTCLVRLGKPAEALPYLEEGIGSQTWLTWGGSAHADALRDLGRGREAAQLRYERLVELADEDKEVTEWFAIAQDLAMAGDPGAAVDACWQGLSIRPRSGTLHAYLADLLLDRGDRDEAEFHLWMSYQYDQETTRALLVEARLLTGDGLHYEAGLVLARAARMRRRSPAIDALQVDNYVAQGLVSEAESIIQLPRNKDLEHPEIMAAWMRLLRATGHDSELEAASARGAEMFPDHPAIQAALADY